MGDKHISFSKFVHAKTYFLTLTVFQAAGGGGGCLCLETDLHAHVSVGLKTSTGNPTRAKRIFTTIWIVI